MNEVLTDSLHALAVRHRTAYRDQIGATPDRRKVPRVEDKGKQDLRELQDQIRALMQDYAPHDMVKEIFDCEDLDSGIDGMIIYMGSGFLLVVPI